MNVFNLTKRLSCSLILYFIFTLPAWSLEQLTLQLKWQHQFQFAGYYAALSQGYYRDAGLDVVVREAKPYEDSVQYVLEGNAEYGVGTSELLLLHHHNQPVVVLAVIFQHSPLVLIVPQQKLKQTVSSVPYHYIQDLKDKPIMLEANSAELLAYLAQEGLSRKHLNLVDHTFDVQDMLSGKAVAMSGYVTDEPFLLQEQNVSYQIFKPIMGGIDFYGDNLFTTQSELQDNPKRVQAFREASLKGWQFAMSHPEEMIDLILNTYSDRHSRAHLRYEYQQMINLMRPDLLEIGYMHPGRWKHIGQTYVKQNMLSKDFNLEGFIYEPNSAKIDYLQKDWITYLSILLFLVLLLVSIFVYFNHLLRKKAKWLNTVLSHAPSALIIMDEDAKILQWNK